MWPNGQYTLFWLGGAITVGFSSSSRNHRDRPEWRPVRHPSEGADEAHDGAITVLAGIILYGGISKVLPVRYRVGQRLPAARYWAWIPDRGDRRPVPQKSE